jgi:hypothetical protein
MTIQRTATYEKNLVKGLIYGGPTDQIDVSGGDRGGLAVFGG